jgi:hypothetical protein
VEGGAGKVEFMLRALVCLSLLLLSAGALAQSQEVQAVRSDAPVYVQLDAPPSVLLSRVMGGFEGSAAERLCRAPCERWLPGGLNTFYFVSGSGMPSSDVFDLGTSGGAMRVKVQPGSNMRRAGGYALGAGGGVATVVGMGVLGFGTVMWLDEVVNQQRHPADLDRREPRSDFRSVQWVGTATALIGGAAIALGIRMVQTGRTGVALEPVPLPPQPDGALP